jgi:hypothetical protein
VFLVIVSIVSNSNRLTTAGIENTIFFLQTRITSSCMLQLAIQAEYKEHKYLQLQLLI